jgi:hypothetical protein
MWSSWWNESDRGNWSTRRKPTPLPLWPPQIPNDLIWYKSQATMVGSQWINTSATMVGSQWLNKSVTVMSLSFNDYSQTMTPITFRGQIHNTVYTEDHLWKIPRSSSPYSTTIIQQTQSAEDLTIQFKTQNWLKPMGSCYHNKISLHTTNLYYIQLTSS